MDGFRPLYTPSVLALAISSRWRSRRRLVSKSIPRKHLPAAILVSIGCSVALRLAPLVNPNESRRRGWFAARRNETPKADRTAMAAISCPVLALYQRRANIRQGRACHHQGGERDPAPADKGAAASAH